MARNIEKLYRRLIINSKGNRQAVYTFPVKMPTDGELGGPFFFLKQHERKLNDLDKEIYQLKQRPMTLDVQCTLRAKQLQKISQLRLYKKAQKRYSDSVHRRLAGQTEVQFKPKVVPVRTSVDSGKLFTHADYVARMYQMKEEAQDE